MSGYYIGAIHLLTGTSVRRYFSFTQNIFDKPGNFERWVRAASAEMRILLLENNISIGSNLVLIGFTGTVRTLISHLCVDAPTGTKAHVVLSYDVPSLEELSAVVKKGNQILLLTDVISSGSSARSLTELIERIGATIIGLISLVDCRQLPDFKKPNLYIAPNKHIKLATCSQADVSAIKSFPDQVKIENEYWVDAVSLIPETNKPPSESIPKSLADRISFTLDSICTTKSAKCGHVVDGTRHMSTYIDVKELIQDNSIIGDHICQSIQSILKLRHWDKFNPKYIVVPTGVARIESINTNQNVIVYDTAVNAYRVILKQLWPKSNDVEVMRAFDPGGNSRCSSIYEVLSTSTKEPFDIVIADDGIWSGRTITSLVNDTLKANAKRILVIPLLARLRTQEILHWESIRSISIDQNDNEIPICYYFPLIYPVPAFSAQECPYELTKNRMQQKVASESGLLSLGTKLLSNLAGKRPYEVEFLDEDYTKAWVKLRCYLEQSTENETAIDNAVDLITSARTNGEQLGFCELLLGEWSILSRARIRQVIAPKLRSVLNNIAVNPQTSSELRCAAVSLLRSSFRDLFLQLLEHLKEFAHNDIVFMERILFHIATLNMEERSHRNCLRFLYELANFNHKTLSNESIIDVMSYEKHASFANKLLVTCEVVKNSTGVDQTDSASKIATELYETISLNPDVRHDLRSYLHNLDASRENLSRCSSAVWKTHADTWVNKIEPLISTEFLSKINLLHDILSRTSTQYSSFINTETAVNIR